MLKRVLVGAHYGLKDWLVQRLSGALLVLFTLGLLIALPFVPNTYEGWHALFSHLAMKIATFTAIVGLVWHIWIGVRDILMDYCQLFWLRMTLLTGMVIFLFANTVWAFNILWSVK